MKQCSVKKMKRYEFGIGFLVLSSILLFVEAHPQVNERCEAQILKEFPDAICHPDQDIKSCNASCKKQAEVKCGTGGRKMIRKLQCRKRKTRKGPFSCCCRVVCKDDLSPLKFTKKMISQHNEQMDMEKKGKFSSFFNNYTAGRTILSQLH